MDKKMMAMGTTMLVLKLLMDEDMYGYQIIRRLEERSNSVFLLKEGTLYPVLHSLEEQQAVESYEKTAETADSTELAYTFAELVDTEDKAATGYVTETKAVELSAYIPGTYTVTCGGVEYTVTEGDSIGNAEDEEGNKNYLVGIGLDNTKKKGFVNSIKYYIVEFEHYQP